MEWRNLFRLTLADEHLGYAQFELVDSINPDAMTRVALGRYLELRLRQEGFWPSADARLVNIEWQAVNDGEMLTPAVSDKRSQFEISDDIARNEVPLTDPDQIAITCEVVRYETSHRCRTAEERDEGDRPLAGITVSFVASDHSRKRSDLWPFERDKGSLMCLWSPDQAQGDCNAQESENVCIVSVTFDWRRPGHRRSHWQHLRSESGLGGGVDRAGSAAQFVPSRRSV